MNRPAYAHANQRSFYRLDPALSELIERITPPEPEPIPVGETSDSEWGEFLDAMWGDL